MFPQLTEGTTQLERRVLEYWKTHDIFARSVSERPADAPWTFYDGPPTVNGNPGVHHLISRALKDMFCRYKTMRGHRVHRKAGWDTHGLPVEIALEKQLGLKEKIEIETKVGVAEFNKLALKTVYEHINKEHGWREFTERSGYWLNLDDPYITCTPEYVESLWWSLKEFYKKNLIYRGYRVTPQCPHCETPLSQHELAQGYRDVRDPSLYVKMEIASSAEIPEPLRGLLNPQDKAYMLVWTTTPWTLISNVALAVGADIDYAVVRDTDLNQTYVLAQPRLAALDPDGKWQVQGTVTGADLRGLRYNRLFDYIPVDKDAFYVVTGSFVSTGDGTGIVHIAPAYGQDDYDVARENNLPMIQAVTPGGRFIEQVTDFAGRTVKTLSFQDRKEDGCDKEIVIKLKEQGLVLKSSNDYLHSYPHCWRCDNPLIYYARDAWYIRTTAYTAEMVRLNETINWQTPEIGSGRFGNWLKEGKDWSLSRDRYWGTPLPIWVNQDNPNDMFAIGSIAELMEGEYEREDGTFCPVAEADKPFDVHKPFVDRVVFRRDGRIYRRTPELIDVWYDSGAMPFAQWHYPFENKDIFEEQSPADFICEGVDQTRGWFYTLHAISVPLFGRPATRNILVNDLVLDDKGQKMSKTKGNVLDPFVLINQYGADAVRWYMVTNSPPWKPTLFNEKELQQTVIADFFRALTNTYNFFTLYANIDGFTYNQERLPDDQRAELDRWILSVMNSMTAEYIRLMDSYEPTRAMRLVSAFTVEQLSNWYVRRNRRRFWKSEMNQDKVAAYQTLYECLATVAKLMAPLAPFISDEIYCALNSVASRETADSVHLAMIPQVETQAVNLDLERRMDRAQRAVALARMLREKSRLKVRQPLRRILIPVASPAEQSDYMAVEDIIRDELNVKSVEYIDAFQESAVVKKKAKANFKSIGPRFGKDAKAVAAAIIGLPAEKILELQRSGLLNISSGSDTFAVSSEDVEVIHEDIEGWLVASEGPTTVALDTTLDPELVQEGLAREFINRVQTLRKETGLDVTDRIVLQYHTDDNELATALLTQREYIMSETLALELLQTRDDAMNAVDLNGIICAVGLKRAETAAGQV